MLASILTVFVACSIVYAYADKFEEMNRAVRSSFQQRDGHLQILDSMLPDELKGRRLLIVPDEPPTLMERVLESIIPTDSNRRLHHCSCGDTG